MLLYGRHKGALREPQRLALYRDLTGKSLAEVALQPAGSLFVRTSDLEEILRTHALLNGIPITNMLVEFPAQLETLHPECSRFIAAKAPSNSVAARASTGSSSMRKVGAACSAACNWRRFPRLVGLIRSRTTGRGSSPAAAPAASDRERTDRMAMDFMIGLRTAAMLSRGR